MKLDLKLELTAIVTTLLSFVVYRIYKNKGSNLNTSIFDEVEKALSDNKELPQPLDKKFRKYLIYAEPNNIKKIVTIINSRKYPNICNLMVTDKNFKFIYCIFMRDEEMFIASRNISLTREEYTRLVNIYRKKIYVP